MVTHLEPTSITDQVQTRTRERVNGGSPVVTRISVLSLNEVEQFTVHGDRLGDDLRVYSAGRDVTATVPSHITSHEAAIVWCRHRIELGYRQAVA